MRSFPVHKVRVRGFGEIALIHAENDFEPKDGRSGINCHTDIGHERPDGTGAASRRALTRLRQWASV